MPTRKLTLDEFISYMRKRQGGLSDRQFAKVLGITPQYLCDIYKRRRMPGESVADAMGVRREVIFIVKAED